MKNDKKSVLLYTEWAEPLRSLPLEEKGRIFDAILSYTENGRMPKFENPATDMAFRWIQQKLDENIQKWEETRAKRAAAGKSGGAPKGNSNAKKQEQSDEDFGVFGILFHAYERMACEMIAGKRCGKSSGVPVIRPTVEKLTKSRVVRGEEIGG